jgi:hypothetical protein
MQNDVNIVLEGDWKYEMGEGTCDYESRDQSKIYVKGYYDVPRNDSLALKQALAL